MYIFIIASSYPYTLKVHPYAQICDVKASIMNDMERDSRLLQTHYGEKKLLDSFMEVQISRAEQFFELSLSTINALKHRYMFMPSSRTMSTAVQRSVQKTVQTRKIDTDRAAAPIALLNTQE